MNWEAIGTVGESIGAIGVIVTLAYLAIQIRLDTRATTATASSAALADIDDLANHNDRCVPLLLQAGRNEPLEDEDRVHVVERFVALMRTYENFWFQYRYGNFSLEQFESRSQMVGWTLSAPVSRRMWAERSGALDREFRACVDSYLLEHALADNELYRAYPSLGTPRSGGMVADER